jgi:competence protein ComEC
VIEIDSKIKSIINISDDFLYAEYMETKNIYFSSYVSAFQHHVYHPPNKLIRTIWNIRQQGLDIIYTLYPKEEAIFLWGILIGARESLPEELKTNFNNSGLTHFIAVSGFNITILIIFLAMITRYLPTPVQVTCVIGSIVLFTLLVWDSAPVVRASVMWWLGYLCLSMWRNSNITSLILTTAVIMIIYNPSSINHDVSLHLSFLAVIGIILLQEWYTRIFSWAPKTLALQEALVLTFAALTTTLPIMLVNFWQVSVLSPISNILVTWTIPLAMLWGFLSVVGFILSPFIGWGFGFFTYLLLKWDIMVVHTIGAWEYSVISNSIGAYGDVFLLFYFWFLIFW